MTYTLSTERSLWENYIGSVHEDVSLDLLASPDEEIEDKLIKRINDKLRDIDFYIIIVRVSINNGLYEMTIMYEESNSTIMLNTYDFYNGATSSRLITGTLHKVVNEKLLPLDDDDAMHYLKAEEHSFGAEELYIHIDLNGQKRRFSVYGINGISDEVKYTNEINKLIDFTLKNQNESD